jgi:hypothetical protein
MRSLSCCACAACRRIWLRLLENWMVCDPASAASASPKRLAPRPRPIALPRPLPRPTAPPNKLPALATFIAPPAIAVVSGPAWPVERLSRLVEPGSLIRMPLMRLSMKTLPTGCEASALEGEGGGLEVQVVLVTVT